MSFFKNLKGKLLGSIKEDLNSALTGKQKLFNSKIAGALDDLIAMKTGINISNIPEGITEQGLIAGEERKAAEKSLEEVNASSGGYYAKAGRTVLKFPTDDNRYVDNWIIFRSIPRQIGGTDLSNVKVSPTEGALGNLGAHGIESADAVPVDKGKTEISHHNIKTQDATIALYFPTGVKDTINVEYEQKEIGISDLAMDKILNQGDLTGLGAETMGMAGEAYDKAKQAMIAFQAFQKGVVIDNPKFNTFQGVSFRDHSYTFNLTPYNINDANSITEIITLFKTLMLPMSTNANRRMMIMPAEWSIDFKGPILGHIEHPQNCFLKSCDVDYSGGKDMSFIEQVTEREMNSQETDEYLQKSMNAGEGEDCGPPPKMRGMQHYPNGITLSLTFQEILNIDRLRYVDRVRAAAKGKEQNVQNELVEFEMELNKANLEATQEMSKDEIFGEFFSSEDIRGTNDDNFWTLGGLHKDAKSYGLTEYHPEFNPNGDYVVSMTAGGHFKIVQVKGGKPVTELPSRNLSMTWQYQGPKISEETASGGGG